MRFASNLRCRSSFCQHASVFARTSVPGRPCQVPGRPWVPGRPCQALFRTSLTLHCDPVSKDPFDLVSLVNQIYRYQRRNQRCKDPIDLVSFGESVSSQVDWPIGAKYANTCQRRMGETWGRVTFMCGLDFLPPRFEITSVRTAREIGYFSLFRFQSFEISAGNHRCRRSY